MCSFNCSSSGAKHVLLIGIDGLGSLYFEEKYKSYPTLKYLIQNGASTFRARSSIPNISAPNWCSILSGMSVIQSGVFDNEWSIKSAEVKPITGTLKTIFDVVKEHKPNTKTALCYNWEMIKMLANADRIDHVFQGNDDKVTEKMAEIINEFRPNLMFVHLDDVDHAGHDTHWGSSVYNQTIKKTDGRIGKMLESLKEANLMDETLVIIVSDHGGKGNDHGQLNKENVFVPAVFYGKRVKKGAEITDCIETIDYAPIVLKAFGIHKPRYMKGVVPKDLFVDDRERFVAQIFAIGIEALGSIWKMILKIPLLIFDAVEAKLFRLR